MSSASHQPIKIWRSLNVEDGMFLLILQGMKNGLLKTEKKGFY